MRFARNFRRHCRALTSTWRRLITSSGWAMTIIDDSAACTVGRRKRPSPRGARTAWTTGISRKRPSAKCPCSKSSTSSSSALSCPTCTARATTPGRRWRRTRNSLSPPCATKLTPGNSLPKCEPSSWRRKRRKEFQQNLWHRGNENQKADRSFARAVSPARPAFSTQLTDASLQHHGRFLLPCRELLRPLAIDVDTTEGLVVGIRDRHQPVVVPATAIFPVARDLAFGHGSSPMGGTIVVRHAHSGCGLLESSGVRFSEAHGHASDTSDDIRLLRIGKPANLATRVGIRNRKEMTFADFAPTANIFLSQLGQIHHPAS